MVIPPIKIGGRRYAVSPMPVGDRAELLGRIDRDHSTLVMNPNVSPDNQAETLLHEILHGVYFAYGLKPGADEETVVTAFGTGLMAVFVDNPTLYKTLMDAALRGRPVVKEGR